MISLTEPPPKRPAAPYARPMSPAETAAKRSAASRSRSLDTASGSPSLETTTASATPGVRSTKLSSSQLTLRAAELRSLIFGLRVAVGSTPLQARPVVSEHGAHILRLPAVRRGPGDARALLSRAGGRGRPDAAPHACRQCDGTTAI